MKNPKKEFIMKNQTFISKTILAAMLVGNCFAFEVSELPEATTRETPDVALNKIYSYHNSIKEATKAVVNISTQKKIKTANIQGHPLLNDPFFKQFFGDSFEAMIPKDRIERSLGSGVIISQDGYIVTNNHVIDGADKIIVTMPNSSKEFEAKVIGSDEKSDLAIVKIEGKNLPFIQFASSANLQVGDMVFAIGNPFGVGESVTQGIISALNKSGMGINDYENFIQTDASINPGNSGGALVDTRGGLIGINTAILSRTGGNHGIGFAIPSEMVKKIAKTLIEKGKVERGFLGVGIQDVNEELRSLYNDQQGAVVIDIQPNSPAQKAGLAVWDLITKVNQTPIKSSAELKNLIGTFNPNEKVTLTFIRDKQEKTATLTLAQSQNKESSKENSKNPKSSSSNAGGIKGLSVVTLSNNLKSQYGIPSDIQGVFVDNVEPNSYAQEVGIMRGDIIVQIESFAIKDSKTFEEATSRYKNQPKRILINRGGRILSIVAK